MTGDVQVSHWSNIPEEGVLGVQYRTGNSQPPQVFLGGNDHCSFVAIIRVGVPVLYQYLDNRFADTVVLTFAQIEALLGFTLPDFARLRPDWWATPEADAVPSSQSRSWVEASRTATPNLRAQSVMFERVSN